MALFFFMQTAFILNPKAGQGDQSSTLRSLASTHNVTLLVTKEAGDAQRLAKQCIEKNFDRIIVGGGDGTLHDVLNGISSDLHRVSVGLVPMGTGNDFARTLDLPTRVEEAFELARHGDDTEIDLIKVNTESSEQLCVNVTAGGFAGQVDEAMTPELKETWGALAYLRCAASVLPQMKDYHSTLSIDDVEQHLMQVVNIVAANGKTAGGGVQIASRARPNDGMFDIVVLGTESFFNMASAVFDLARGEFWNNENVFYVKAKKAELHIKPAMTFNIDGELIEKTHHIAFEIKPRALRMVVSPSFRAHI